jgi:uncharacterized membrane protein
MYEELIELNNLQYKLYHRPKEVTPEEIKKIDDLKTYVEANIQELANTDHETIVDNIIGFYVLKKMDFVKLLIEHGLAKRQIYLCLMSTNQILLEYCYLEEDLGLVVLITKACKNFVGEIISCRTDEVIGNVFKIWV